MTEEEKNMLIFDREYDAWLKENVPELTAQEIDGLSAAFEEERGKFNQELTGTFLDNPFSRQ